MNISIKNLKNKPPTLNLSDFIVLKDKKIFSEQIILLRTIVYDTNHIITNNSARNESLSIITRIELIILYVVIYTGFMNNTVSKNMYISSPTFYRYNIGK